MGDKYLEEEFTIEGFFVHDKALREKMEELAGIRGISVRQLAEEILALTFDYKRDDVEHFFDDFEEGVNTNAPYFLVGLKPIDDSTASNIVSVFVSFYAMDEFIKSVSKNFMIRIDHPCRTGWSEIKE